MDTLFAFLSWLVVDVLGSDVTRNVAVVFGVVVAIFSIRAVRTVARKKQSADMLFSSRGDDELQKGYLRLLEFHNGKENVRQLVNDDHSQSDEAKSIRYLLNHLELLAVGIRAGIYDEAMLKDSWFSIVTDTYDRATPYIQASRERFSKETIWQELEWLAKRWKKKRLRVRLSR